MDNNASQSSKKPELPTKLKLENTVDTSGMFVSACVSLYKIARMAPGSGWERLLTASHTSLIGQNLPRSFILGSATSAVHA
jgi:hypothetical protein